MRVLFEYQDILGVVENGVADLADSASEAEKKTHGEIKKKDRKALFYIHEGVNDSVFGKIDGATTAKQVCDILETSYHGVEKGKKVRLQTLRRQFEILQIETAESVADYVTRVLALKNQIKINGEKVADLAIVEKILRSHNKI